jgi:hypothetical protein
MAPIKGLQQLASKKPTGEIGTKASGFSEGGPFSCNNCVHMTHKNNVDVCSHPKVNSDPELKDEPREGGLIMVDFDDCCRYVRPPEEAKEEAEEHAS